MSYPLKPTPCRKHKEYPVLVYNECVGCYIKELLAEKKKLEETITQMKKEMATLDTGVKCVTSSSSKQI